MEKSLVLGGTVNTEMVNANDLAGGWDRPDMGRQTIQLPNTIPVHADAFSLVDATNLLSVTAKRLTNSIPFPLPAVIACPDGQADFFKTVFSIANGSLQGGVVCTAVRINATDPSILELVFELGGFIDIVQLISNDSVSWTFKMQIIKTGWLWCDQLLYTTLEANQSAQIQGDTLYYGQAGIAGKIEGQSRPVRTFFSPYQQSKNVLISNRNFIFSKTRYNIFMLTNDFGGGTTNSVAFDYNIRKYVDNVDFKGATVF